MSNLPGNKITLHNLPKICRKEIQTEPSHCSYVLFLFLNFFFKLFLTMRRTQWCHLKAQHINRCAINLS